MKISDALRPLLVLLVLGMCVIAILWPAMESWHDKQSSLRQLHSLSSHLEALTETPTALPLLGTTALIVDPELGDISFNAQAYCDGLGRRTGFRVIECSINVPELNANHMVHTATVRLGSSGRLPALHRGLSTLAEEGERLRIVSASLHRGGDEGSYEFEAIMQIPVIEADTLDRARSSVAIEWYETVAVQPMSNLLSRNPFDERHQSYRPPSPPPPAPPEVIAELLGISTIQGVPTALMSFDGEEMEVQAGDQTPLGEIAQVLSGSVTFVGNETEPVTIFD